MTLMELVGFLVPKSDDALSLVFVLLLVLPSLATIVLLWKYAKEEYWEEKWGRYAEEGINLNSEHGSAYELAEAVATKSEQIAEIMPSMLLIIGLLGTFMGLGLALNSASEVLNVVGSDITGMNNAMNNLTSLMEGLGAKFKTSTWGLLCFIGLNIVFNVLGFKEKRLSWAIQKIHQEIEEKNMQKARFLKENHTELYSSIINFNKNNHNNQKALNQTLQAQITELKTNIGAVQSLEKKSEQNTGNLLMGLQNQNNNLIDRITQKIGERIAQAQQDNDNQHTQLQSLIDVNKNLGSILINNHQDLIKNLQSQTEQLWGRISDGLMAFKLQISDENQQKINELKNITSLMQGIQNSSNLMIDELQAIKQETNVGFKDNVECLTENSEKCFVELNHINEQSKVLQQTFKDFANKINEGIGYLNASNSDMMVLIDGGIKKQSEKLEAIVASNQSIQQASKDTTTELKNTITTLKTGFEQNTKQLQKGSDKSLEQLQNIAKYNQQTQQAMQDFVDKAVDSIASIGESANKMGESALAVGESANDLNGVVKTLKSDLGDVISMIKTDLGDTISDMGENFKENIAQMSGSIKENMAEMSSSMSSATKGIEGAVSDLSINVGNTMNEVTQTIGESMSLQEKSAREFTLTSESLNIEIMTMTHLVKQLEDNILGSLQSVSENGRHMKNIGKKLEDFSEFIKNLSNTNPQLIEHLEKITTHNEEIANSLSQLLEKNDGEYWQNLIDMNKSIKNELNNLVALLGQSIHTKYYENVLESIHSSINDLSKQLTAYHQNQQKELTNAEKAK